MHAHALAAEMILERQSALPGLRRQRSIHVLHHRLRIVPGERHTHDFRQRHRFADGNAPRARHRRPARRQRIARLNEIVSDRAALDVRLRPPRTIGENFAFPVAVFLRVGINQNRRGAFALRRQSFESTIAVRIRIAHQHNLPAHADSLRAQIVVVLRIAAVRINHRRGNFARSRISEKRTGGPRILGVRVHFVRRLAETRAVFHRRSHLERNFSRLRVQHVVFVDLDILHSLLLPLFRHPPRQLVIALRPRRVRLGRQIAMKSRNLRRRGQRAILLLDGHLVFRGLRRKARERNLLCKGRKSERCHRRNRDNSALMDMTRDARKLLTAKIWRQKILQHRSGEQFRVRRARCRAPLRSFESVPKKS